MVRAILLLIIIQVYNQFLQLFSDIMVIVQFISCKQRRAVAFIKLQDKF